jgi:hypothetical protein
LSAHKTHALLLNPQAAEHPLVVNVDGVELNTNTQPTRYLGLLFDKHAGAGCMASHRATCMASAFYVTFSRIRAAPDFPCVLPTQLKMLHSVVEPTGLYGSELWGLGSVAGIWSRELCLKQLYSLQDALELQRCTLLKKWLRLPEGTPSLCLLHELGCEPMVHYFVRRALRFYNELSGLPDTSIYRGVLRQNIEEGLSMPCPARNFTAALFNALRVLQIPNIRQLGTRLRSMQYISPKDVNMALRKAYSRHIMEFMAITEGEGCKIGFYFRCVSRHCLKKVPKLYSLHLPQMVLHRCLRFRLGAHHLHINTGRWTHPPLPRHQRLCQRCPQRHAIDDETHCVLYCMHPVLAAARGPMLLALSQHVPHMRLCTFQQFCTVCSTIKDDTLHALCARFLALCCRVAWHCYEVGGTDIQIEIPAMWMCLPEDLDCFDSSSSSSEDN